MLVAIEALKTGTTCITDDLFESPAQTLSQLNACVQAYDDISVSAYRIRHMIDRSLHGYHSLHESSCQPSARQD